MTSWLKRQIEKLDRSRARLSRIEPARLILAPRTPRKRKFCLDCRRTPDVRQIEKAWYATFSDDPWAALTHPWPGIGPDCPYCGGQLIEVTD